MKLKHMVGVTLLFAVPLLAAAHGDQPHSATKTGPTKKEQKAWGIAGDASRVNRTIDIKMLDEMRFTPDTLEVQQGDTIRLLMTNTGKVQHELVIGTQKELEEHAALMARFPNMQHDEPYMAHVSPGQVGEIVWTFNRPGEFDFACLIAGHYQAGMMGKIRVVAAG